MSNVAVEEYASSLSDLTVNSKPLINMLTMLAEDNIEHAPAIVQAVEKHLQKVPSDIKLPVLYLIDSIVKNVGRAYITLFTQNIVSTFISVFEKVDEKTRAQMFKLRQTWNDVFPAKKLYAMDVRVCSIDPAWPITAPVPTSIHVNPKFLSKVAPGAPTAARPLPAVVPPRKASASSATATEAEMREQLLKKQKELLELQQRKLELELLQTKARLEEQQKQLERQTGHLHAETTQTPVVLPSVKPLNNTAVKPPVVQNNSIEASGPEKAQSTKAPRNKTNSRPSRDPRLTRSRAAVPTPAVTAAVTTTPTTTPVTTTTPVNSISVSRVTKETRTSSRKDHRPAELQPPQPAASTKADTSSRPTQRSKGVKTQAPSRVAKNGETTPQPQVLPPSDVLPSRSSPKKRERERERDVPRPGPLPELAEPDVSASPSPPPSRVTAAPSTTFKEVKSSRKGRSFRKRREGSTSPSPPEVTSQQPQRQQQQQHQPKPQQKQSAPSADVDLRGPPPDKISRLSLSPKPLEPHVNADTKDVDLRPLSRTSPSKKRQSAERSDQPPPKKSKAEMIDVLFGSEDVDLRTLVPIAVAPLPPSPPPPPVISHPSPPPVVTAPQPSPPPVSPVMPAAAAGQGDEGGAAGWAQLKESRPDAYKSSSLPPPSPQQAHQVPLFGRPLVDRLGRPLLYRRPPNQSHEEQRPIIASGEDTDMRMPRMDADIELNVNMIIAQAEEQLKNGNISFKDYNTLLKQVIHINEIQKLREAQRRDEQEDKENWGRARPSIRRTRTASPINNEDSSHEARASPPGVRFGDIDERFPTGGPTMPPPPPPQWAPHPPSWTEHPSWGPRSVQAPPPVTSAPPVHHQPPPPFRRPPDFGPPPFRWRHYGPSTGPGHPPRHSFDRQDDLHRFERYPGGRFTRPPPLPPPPPHHTQPPPHLSQPPPQHRQEQLQQPPSPSCGGELPPADPLLLDLIAQDSMRTINIDGVPREIRFYGDTAVVLLAWDEPREISFQGGTRRVTFDDRDSVVCSFNEPYRDFTLEGQTHRIRLGAPTRELYIDGKWYECFFGGPPVNVDIGGKIRSVKLDGPPPQVKIGYVKRTDLVAGKINLIINAKTMVPVFLDAKPQRFDIENKPHVLRFVNALRTVLINGRPIEVEFGGLPKPIMVRGRKHFVRFSVLPAGVRPGRVNIINMEGRRAASPETTSTSAAEETTEPPITSQPPPVVRQGHDPVLPMLGGATRNRTADQEQDSDSPETSGSSNSPVVNGASGTDTMQQVLTARGQMPLEMLTSLIPASMAPAAASGVGYHVEQQEVTAQQQPQQSQQTSQSALPLSLADINVEELFRKLVATGIVPAGPGPAGTASGDEKRIADDSAATVRPVDFSQPETLKVRQPALVTQLYSGIQCSSCGVRFPPEHTMKYSQHLDWHFRQNRRERDSTRKAQSRKWYYDVSDWIQFEEIEDLEERAQSWFETQQPGGTGVIEEVVAEIPSVAAEGQEDTSCEVCHDRFEQFYNEEREEWHLRKAIRVDGHVYHPLCYEDLKASEAAAAAAEEISSAAEDRDNLETSNSVEEEKKVVSDSAINDSAVSDSSQLTLETDKMDSACEVAEGKAVPAEVKDEDVLIKTEEKEQVADIKSEPMETMEQDSAKASTDPVPLKEEEEIKLAPEDAEGAEDDSEISAPPLPVVDTTLAAVACSIDGNVQFEDTPQQMPGLTAGRIKINIGKATAVAEPAPSPPPSVITPEGLTPTCETPEPPPPGVEPVSLKPLLVGRKMTELPPVARGTELSGLCSIM